MATNEEDTKTVVLNFQILTEKSTQELADKVSKAIADMNWKLVGAPFVFRDSVCQAIAYLGRGS
jgi:hypothetical protein